MRNSQTLRTLLMVAATVSAAAAVDPYYARQAKPSAPHKRDRSAERLAAAQAKRERRQAKARK